LRKIIVTGHTGFLGSHISKYFKDKKYQIVGISRKKESNLDFKQYKIDITKNKVPVSLKKFDVIHCAGITDIQYCQDNPKECFEINLLGTIKMLEFARKNNSKFIFLSTSHVYGMPQKLPIKEGDRKKPISVYASSKYAAELCCMSYAEQYGMNITILRPFSIYGPKEANHFVISNIISQLKNNKKIEIGNLYPKRDFIFVSDVVDAVETVLKKTNGLNIFNVSTGKDFSINDVCKMLMKISQNKKEIKSKKILSRKKDIKKIVGDSSSLRKLGWKPKISLLEGLKITFDG
jgi:UDP-glucose 4-epimerase